MPPTELFLPGRLTLTRGSWRDYQTLARFHYVAKRPATCAAVWTVRYSAPDAPPRVVAVGVVSYPVISSHARQAALRLRLGATAQLRFANRHIRAISRVIVHPQFRALGLSSRLVRCICRHCNTRYVEAMAVMGQAHPFFERGGMRRFEPTRPGGPVYYLYTSRRRP